MFPKKTTTKKNTAKLKVLEPHKYKITKLKEGKKCFFFFFLLVGIAEKRNSYWKQDGETYFAGSWHSQAWNVSKTVGDIHHGSTLQDMHSILKTMTHKDLYKCS